jgi:hypothetical protein
MDSGEPFGLPKGTVRGIIALGMLALVGYDFAIDQALSADVMAFAGPYLGFYFATRGNEPSAPKPEPLAAPYVPGDPEAQG